MITDDLFCPKKAEIDRLFNKIVCSGSNFNP